MIILKIFFKKHFSWKHYPTHFKVFQNLEFFFHNYNKSLVVKLKAKETFSISPIVHSLSGGKYKNLLVNGKSLILFSPNCIQCNARRMRSNGLPFIGEKFCMDFRVLTFGFML